MALDDRAKKYAQHRARGVGRRQSSLLAGYDGDPNNAQRVEEQPEVAALIAELQLETVQNTKITKETVAAGLLQAATLAKQQGDPVGLISAWRELGKLLGHYSPEVKKLEKGINKDELKKVLADMSDEELMTLSRGRIIDGTVTGKTVAALPDLRKIGT